MNIEKILDKTNSDKKVEAYFPLLIKFILKEQMRKFRCKQVGGIVQNSILNLIDKKVVRVNGFFMYVKLPTYKYITFPLGKLFLNGNFWD